MKTVIPLCLLISFLFQSCKKEYPLPTELPPATTVGNNTFGCLINGSIFVPEIRTLTGPDEPSDLILSPFPTFPDYYFSIEANRVDNKTDTVSDAMVIIACRNVKTKGSYKIFGANVIYKGDGYVNDSLLPGAILISRFDSIAHILSGTFYFKARGDYSTQKDTLTISDGRFDFKLQ